MQTVRSPSPTSISPATQGSFQTQQQQDLQKQQILQEQQSASRRLISRFTTGFGTKPRSIGDFTIHLDEPHRHYSNGDSITGHVRLHVLKPVKITHIVVSLAGIVQVHKNPVTGSDGGRSALTTLSASAKGSASGAGKYFGNGVATLFEDEVILCGDGRLGDRIYQFNFELQFPGRELPSSIDFERGNITYLVTATLTRPTAISPTSTTEHAVNFVERIDIARLYPPKSRTIILDPISKRSKAKSQAIKRLDATDRKASTNRSAPNGTTPARPSSSSQEGERALSPVPSEVSVDSRASSNGVASQSQSGSVTASPAASFVGRTTHSKTGAAYKTISTVIQPRTGGCLRGDQVLVDIKVNHTKHMRSLNGVIVTLYRTARVETQPALPIGVIDGVKKPEEYFTRSITGLGGLSLSGAGSAHIFRKDLAQVVMPLVINPATLGADVVAKLRVPEEAFPTISGVPGAMISFKYYLEVIVDIQGRLAGPDKALNNLGEITNTAMAPSDAYEIDWSATTTTGQGILNTTYVRRDKGVVSATFEIIVGTTDTERRKGKQKADPAIDSSPATQAQVAVPVHPPTFDSILGGSNSQYLQHSPSFPSGFPATPERETWHETNGYDTHHDHVGPSRSPVLPPPQIPDESQLSEKERLRLAESRLLPSQPPGLEDEVTPSMQRPTAPRIAEDGTPLPVDDYNDLAPRDEYADLPAPVNGQNYHESALPDGATSTAHELGALPVAAVVPPVDDKQELERSRLQAQESAPFDDAAPVTSAAASDTSAATEHDSHAEASGSADLPRYER